MNPPGGFILAATGPQPPLRGTFSLGEKVAEGRMRGFNLRVRLSSPRPPLRGTFSLGEKVD